ncbi:MAG: hypothetical protein IJD90_01045 [Clostridia bacterium]|nr:hypothetical protein [Clostridia bacterium]
MFKIKLAGFIIEIRNRYDFVKKQCVDYVVDDNEKALFSVEATDLDIENEQNSTEYNFDKGYLESVCIYRNIAYELPKHDAFLFHAAVVEVDNNGYAFTAKSGVGKSTHIKLWKELLGDKLTIVNGDKPIIREIDGKIYAFGTPWCGKEGYNVNTSVELKAICFVNRGEVDEIVPFDKSKAVSKIVHQIIVPKSSDDIVKVLEMLDSFIKKLDIWKLKCTMNISAAKVSFNAMKGGQISEN